MTAPVPPGQGSAPDAVRPVRSTFSQFQSATPSQPKAWEALLGAVDHFARLATAHDGAGELPQASALYRRAVDAWHARESRVGLPPELRDSIEPQIRKYEARAAALDGTAGAVGAGAVGFTIAGAARADGAALAAVDTGSAATQAAVLARVMDTRVVIPPNVCFDDIAGCEQAKRQLLGAIRLPLLAPQLFTRGRETPGGILLYGPPGTGKTMLAKAAANMVKTNMFAIEAADVTDKYLGESEKFIKALFEVARANAPAIVFIDEIDALLGARRSDESDAVRRIKNQFFTAIAGFKSSPAARVLVVGATNRPWDLDDGALRRFEQRIHVPLPEIAARQAMFKQGLQGLGSTLVDSDYAQFATGTEGWSGADIAAVVRAAAMIPIDPLIQAQYLAPDETGRFRASAQEVPGSVAVASVQDFSQFDLYDDVTAADVRAALARSRPSVQPSTLQQFAAYEASNHSQEH